MPEKTKFNFKYLFKVIVYISALLFAVYLVLLASGYKFDRRRNNFINTGSIYINSNPKDVKVYLDGKLKAVKTPFKLSYILPGDYHLSIEKDGFRKWEKNIVVKSGLVTSWPEVILFYDQIIKDSVSEIDGIKGFRTNKAKDELIYWTENKIYWQKINSNQAQKLVENNNFQIEEIETTPNFSRMLIKGKDLTTQTATYLFCSNKECQESYDLNRGLNLVFDKAELTDDDSFPLLLSTQDNLYSIANDYSKYYLDSKVISFSFFSGKIYYLSNSDEEAKISSFSTRGDDEKVITTQKINSNEINNLALLADNNKDRLFFIGAGHKLYQVDTGASALDEIKTEATALNFDNSNFLLIQNSSELKVQGKVELTDEEKSLHEVVRYSSDLLRVGWLWRTNHLLFIRDRRLKTVEIKGSNETDLFIFGDQGQIDYQAISKNEIIILDQTRLNKLTVTDQVNLINFW